MGITLVVRVPELLSGHTGHTSGVTGVTGMTAGEKKTILDLEFTNLISSVS